MLRQDTLNKGRSLSRKASKAHITVDLGDVNTWEKDTINGKFSYSKMIYERNQRHFNQPASQGEATVNEKKAKAILKHKRYPLCGTGTGTFSQFKHSDSDRQVNKNLGLGISIYFKQLKSLIVLFLAFSVLKIPSFILFYYGGESQIVFNDSKIFFSTFTLGNLG
jgi:hypothetical protein